MSEQGLSIMGRYKDDEPEELDRAKDEAEADFLLGEFKRTLDSGWTIWKE